MPRPEPADDAGRARQTKLADVLLAIACLLLSLPTSMYSLGSSRPAGYRAPGLPDWQAPVPPFVPTLIVVASCALIVVRRRWPEVTVAGATATALAYLLAASPVGSPVVLVACYSLAVYRSSRAGTVGLGAMTAAVGAVAVAASTLGALPPLAALNSVLSQFVIALLGLLVGVNVGNRKRYVEAIIERSRQLLVERDQQARLATDAERRRIAREMHDIVSHSLTVVVALTEGAAATDDRERARVAELHAAQTARAALHEMRSMLGVLRDDAGGAPLTPVDEDVVAVSVERARQAGFPVSLTVSGAPDAPLPVRFALGRVVQEGLTNAMRHAPHASSIDVAVAYLPDAVAIDVRNDGVRGTGTVAAGGYGLVGLRERVAHVGGTLQSGSAGDGRWRLHAHLPFPADLIAVDPGPAEETP